MAENENMIIEEPKEKKVTWAKFKAGFKEWGRKQIVNLKRRPSNIAKHTYALRNRVIYCIAVSFRYCFLC